MNSNVRRGIRPPRRMGTRGDTGATYALAKAGISKARLFVVSSRPGLWTSQSTAESRRGAITARRGPSFCTIPQWGRIHRPSASPAPVRSMHLAAGTVRGADEAPSRVQAMAGRAVGRCGFLPSPTGTAEVGHTDKSNSTHVRRGSLPRLCARLMSSWITARFLSVARAMIAA